MPSPRAGQRAILVVWGPVCDTSVMNATLFLYLGSENVARGRLYPFRAAFQFIVNQMNVLAQAAGPSPVDLWICGPTFSENINKNSPRNDAENSQKQPARAARRAPLTSCGCVPSNLI